MDKYEQELLGLIARRRGFPGKVMGKSDLCGRQYIHTNSHGFLVIPKGSLGYTKAWDIVDYRAPLLSTWKKIARCTNGLSKWA